MSDYSFDAKDVFLKQFVAFIAPAFTLFVGLSSTTTDLKIYPPPEWGRAEIPLTKYKQGYGRIKTKKRAHKMLSLWLGLVFQSSFGKVVRMGA